MAKKVVPQIAGNSRTSKEVSGVQSINFQREYPCWRINKFDAESKWGVSAVYGDIKFSCSLELVEKVNSLEDLELDKAITSIDGVSFSTLTKFWNRFSKEYKHDIPLDIVNLINESISQSFFAEKIYPKLKEFEKRTWEDIERETYGERNKTKHHFVKINKFIKEARDRLSEKKLNDTDELFSLRLEGKIRIYGNRKLNYMEIIWIDPYHEICPSKAK